MPFTLMFGHAADAVAASDVALVASGTATLETALVGRPMVIAYKMSPWSWRLMRGMRYLPWVCCCWYQPELDRLRCRGRVCEDVRLQRQHGCR